MHANYHIHKYMPYLDGTLSLYCQFCGNVVLQNVSKRTPTTERERLEDTSEDTRSEGEAPNKDSKIENIKEPTEEEIESYQEMEADLLAHMKELYPHQNPEDNIPVRPEFETEGDIADWDVDYEGLIF